MVFGLNEDALRYAGMKIERENIIKSIRELRNGGHHYFNMFQEGGAVCYECNGMYLLFEVPLYGGLGRYEGTFSEKEIPKLVDEALSWT